MTANERTKEIYARILGQVNLRKDNVRMTTAKLVEEKAALDSAERILSMLERHYPEVAKTGAD